MTLGELSIKRPVFITCVIIVMIVIGIVSFFALPVDQMPEVNLPTVAVSVAYPGAGPQEIETLITKPLEEHIGIISGLKRITSKSLEGQSQVTAEFQLKVDVKWAEQQVRDKVSSARPFMPTDIKEPTIMRFDPSSASIMTLAIQGNLNERELYDLAEQYIKPRIEQLDNVGQVQIKGGRKREIQIQLDRNQLVPRQFSVTQITNQLRQVGENIPSGKIQEGDSETVFRSIGEFKSLKDISETLVGLKYNNTATTVGDLGKVVDTLEDESSRVFVNGKKSLFMNVYKQSGSNTLGVNDAVIKAVGKMAEDFKTMPGTPSIDIVQNSSKAIRDNVEDVEVTIILGIVLTVFVVFFFLGNGRSTIITSLALPNSLIGAFILMAMANFSINVISLMALSLAVGLLIDDAIVVRENIFRHIEEGASPMKAAVSGTHEVTLAVIATTAVVIAVFAPVGFMSGIIGQFLKQFGFTICFAMAISLFDALTIAPMLSAYLASGVHTAVRGEGRSFKTWIWDHSLGWVLAVFNKFQDWLERVYGQIIAVVVRRPLITLFISIVVFVLSMATVKKIPVMFIPEQDNGEFSVSFDLPTKTNLDATTKMAMRIDEILRKHKEVAMTTITVGGMFNESYKASFYVRLIPRDARPFNTPTFKDMIRNELLADPVVATANPKVGEFKNGGGPGSALMLNLIGADQVLIREYAFKLVELMKKNEDIFYDVDTTFRPGKPEFQVAIKSNAASVYGVNTKTIGSEIRSQIEGVVPVKFREKGFEYNVRVRMQQEQRNLKDNFSKMFVPNINNWPVRLNDVATTSETEGAATIDRLNRGYYVQITSSVVRGVGTNKAIEKIDSILKDDLKLPPQIKPVYAGSTEMFQEMIVSMLTAAGFGVLIIYLVLASLFESFITPFTIMLALPLAISGAFVLLFVVQEPISLFAMLGILMLMGVACKNSILLVDYTIQQMQNGLSRADALIAAGKVRLRPILMTSIALIAGTIPVAIGLNESSKQRTAMGYAIIGGLISSTLLTLIVIPAAFSYIDRFRVWSNGWMKRIFMAS